MWASDHINPAIPHLNQKNVAYVAIGRASPAKLQAHADRLGWKNVEFVSSQNNSFNHDFKVSFGEEWKEKGQMDYNYATQPFYLSDAPGISVFEKEFTEDGVKVTVLIVDSKL